LFRQVAGDFGKADELAFRIADGVDDGIRPEARAVLAHAPAFALVAAFARGDRQSTLRLAFCTVLLGIKARDVPADDFLGALGPEWTRCGMRPMPGVGVTLIGRDVETPYSGMLPGYVAGLYRFGECHIDVVRLARFAGARLIHDEAIGLDRNRRQVLCRDHPP